MATRPGNRPDELTGQHQLKAFLLANIIPHQRIGLWETNIARHWRQDVELCHTVKANDATVVGNAAATCRYLCCVSDDPVEG